MGPPPCPPPWTVVALISQHLEPKTLAVASCVSKSWNSITSSDHLWKPICFSLYPSLSQLPPAAAYKSLFTLLFLSSNFRRSRVPVKPRIGVEDLVFYVDLFLDDSPVLSLAADGGKLVSCGGVFRYEMYTAAAMPEEARGLRAVWAVVLKGWKGVFVVMDEGTAVWVPGGDAWFSQELPVPRCCRAESAKSGMEAEVGFRREEGTEAVKVSVGLMSVVEWRYVGTDDALRYLQHFLL